MTRSIPSLYVNIGGVLHVNQILGTVRVTRGASLGMRGMMERFNGIGENRRDDVVFNLSSDPSFSWEGEGIPWTV